MEFDDWRDEDLLDLLVCGKGGSRPLLNRFRGLRGVGRAGYGELLKVSGVGPARARALLAFFVLARRFAREPLRRGCTYRNGREIFHHFRTALRDLRKERFLAVLLDGRHRILGSRMISEGSLTASLVHPREVFSPAIRESAGAIVLVHNHPSGDPTPSPQDIEVTRRLRRVGELVGIRVLDHVIIGEESFTSFLDCGWLLGTDGSRALDLGADDLETGLI